MEKLDKLKEKKAYIAFRQKRKKYDFTLIAVILLLCIYGIIVLSSATLSYDTDSYVRRQLLATGIGLVAMILFMFIDFRIWKKIYLLIYFSCIILLVATLVFGHGDTSWGSRSWLKIGPINFQPAEFVKVGLILSFATYLEKIGDINSFWTFIKTLVFAFFPVGLILLQPDVGTAAVYIFFIACMLFFADISWKYIFRSILTAAASLPIIYLFLGTYQKERILNFLDPSRDTSGSGYQAYEGQIAIGSGKLTGKGLYQGSQTQYNFIPTKETDAIFPVLVEELGFIGGFSLLILYGIMLYRFLQIARQSKDLMGKYLVVGFAGMFIIHIWENIGMFLGLMPITGIPLPFMSYGGTFQLINLISLGFILSVRYHRSKD